MIVLGVLGVVGLVVGYSKSSGQQDIDQQLKSSQVAQSSLSRNDSDPLIVQDAAAAGVSESL